MASIAAESSAKGPKLGTVLPSGEVEGLEVKSDRRERLREIELKMQQRWKENKTFEVDAPKEYTQADKKKFFCTFPYPYMNGKIHLGHTFSLTKAEFAAGYHMVKGETVLFPFAFHCTGMPIQAAANKLKKEIEDFGLENCRKGVFENEEQRLAARKAAEEKAAAAAAAVDKNLGKFKGKKTKLVTKTAGKRQWEILVQCGVPMDEIPKFVDAEYWLQYFPPHGQADLTRFGLHTDWRRSFITTSTNPYYDSFIRWQFNTLKRNKVIGFGNRPTVYSIEQGQACADHARSDGEGNGPQEYTLIKLRVLDTALLCSNVGDDGLAEALAGRVVYLVAATLRPETMYGQTNCFILPTGDYGAYAMKDNEVFVCSARSALNMAYQDMTEARGEARLLGGSLFKGLSLLGLPLKAPNAVYEKVYTLPLLSISMGKGTGVVTSVPSDAPDDYIALRDLQRNEGGIRDRFPMLTEEMVNFDVVPIITIPGGDEDIGIEEWGPCAAVTGCEVLKVKNQHDSKKLIKIKKSCYNKGFYQGVMQVGSQKGTLVQEAKPFVRKEMLDEGTAAVYWEPEGLTISRSGDECIVAFIDQWYITYGEETWRDTVMGHVQDPKRFNAYTEGSLKQYVRTLNWLGNWACSRNFGLGTRLPWDEQFVIESLSDSTIYMAYYTIAHLLQGKGNVDGTKIGPSGVAPADMTEAAWDFVYQQGPMPSGASETVAAALKQFRHEFEYWYPQDMRASAKDLVRNHLTMSLYNHVSIWKDRPEMWTKSYFTNGLLMVDGEKMSKSKGNFVTLSNALETDNVRFDGKAWSSQSWCADSVRIACADGGDSNDDGNFETETANAAIMRLFTDIAFVEEFLANEKTNDPKVLRPSGSPLTTVDQVFMSKMNRYIAEADEQYEKMFFKNALKAAFYEYKLARDQYVNYHKLAEAPMHQDVLRRYIESATVIMSPITSHVSEYIWMDLLGNTTSVTKASWPEPADADPAVISKFKYVEDTIASFRKSMEPPKKKKKKKGKAAAPEKPYVKPTDAYAYIELQYPPWRLELLDALNNVYKANDNSFPKTAMKDIMPIVKQSEVLKAEGKTLMKVAAFIMAEVKSQGPNALLPEMPFEELSVLAENRSYIMKKLGLKSIEFFLTTDASAKVVEGKEAVKGNSLPGKPSVAGFA
jgi:leucyl-tRNA synthetase